MPLLACQLHSWGCQGATPIIMEKLASTLLSLIHTSPIPNLQNLPEMALRGAQIRSEALPPFLALLPALASAGSQFLPTLKCLVVHLHDILARVENFLKNQHLNLAIFEGLCKTLEALLQSPKWTSDIFEQDSREIIFEDLDYLLRFVGLHFVCAKGGENFKIFQLLLNILIHMMVSSNNPEVSSGFQRFTLNIITDCIADLTDR